MKQRTRLLIAFCTIIFVPIVLVWVAFCSFRHIQMKELQENYGIEATDYTYLLNTVQLLNRYTEEDFEALVEMADKNPGQLENVAYLREVDDALAEKNSFLLVRKGEEIYFLGGAKDYFVPEYLPEYKGENSIENWGAYIDNADHALIKQIDFLFSDGAEGSAFIISNVQEMIPELKDMIVDMLISVVLILVFTASMMAIWIYSSMIGPIRRLQLATKNIMEDNLDFTIEAEANDEIGELCQNFEEMRKRLKEFSEERLNNERQNRELISNISHDLKTPLTAVRGYVEGLIDGVADTPEKMDHYIKTIYNKTNEMTRLVNELTLYSQINTNRIPYNFNKINVADYFNDCAEELSMELESKNIGLQYMNFVTDDVMIIADPEQMRRVIGNIINNTVKYLDKPHGRINLRIKDVGDFIQVEIEDNGIGIAAKDLPYIFDRFYRTDASRNSATGGSGIGLSIVKKIIEDHGGKIWATSKEGIGTVMYFVIRKYQVAEPEISGEET
ncbi:HAMP domain-containing sensor histidine kinase [Lachnospiraceae bacterium 47-T17]